MMKRVPQSILITAVAASTVLAVGSSQAATLSGIELGFLSGRISGSSVPANNYNATGGAVISFFDGNSFLQPNPGVPANLSVPVNGSGRFMLDPVLDYAFYNESFASPFIAGARDVIGTPTGDDTTRINSREETDYYTTNDPDAAVPTPNFTARQLEISRNPDNTPYNQRIDLTAAPSTAPLNIFIITGGWFSSHTVTLEAFDSSDVSTGGPASVSYDKGNADGFGGDQRQPQVVYQFTVEDFEASDYLNINITGQNELTINGLILTSTAIPEPATAGLALVGLGGLCLKRRRRHSSMHV